MKQWLITFTVRLPEILSGGPTDDEMAAVGRHFAYWQDLASRDVALVVGRTQTTDPDTLGLAIFRSSSEDEAREIMDKDPGVLAGVFEAKLRPYAVALLGNPGPFTPGSS